MASHTGLRSWILTIAISIAALVTMYGLAYLNEAHGDVRAISATSQDAATSAVTNADETEDARPQTLTRRADLLCRLHDVARARDAGPVAVEWAIARFGNSPNIAILNLRLFNRGNAP